MSRAGAPRASSSCGAQGVHRQTRIWLCDRLQDEDRDLTSGQGLLALEVVDESAHPLTLLALGGSSVDLELLIAHLDRGLPALLQVSVPMRVTWRAVVAGDDDHRLAGRAIADDHPARLTAASAGGGEQQDLPPGHRPGHVALAGPELVDELAVE